LVDGRKILSIGAVLRSMNSLTTTSPFTTAPLASKWPTVSGLGPRLVISSPAVTVGFPTVGNRKPNTARTVPVSSKGTESAHAGTIQDEHTRRNTATAKKGFAML